MSANSYDALNPIEMAAKIQDFQQLTMASSKIADMRFKVGLQQGKAHDFPYVNDPTRQNYTPGIDLTVGLDEATSDQLTITQTPAVTITDDPISQAQRADKTLLAQRDLRSGQILAAGVDQTLFSTGLDAVNSRNTVAGGTLSATNIMGFVLDVKSRIKDYEIGGMPLVAAIDPTRSALLSEYFIANGFNQADNTLVNGLVGKAGGVTFYESNSLPYSANLQMATNPTAGDTIEIKGVTFTFVSSIGTTAGNVLIGANIAATQANLKTLIDDVTTTTATGVALSKEDQSLFLNNEVEMGAWSSDVATVTGYGSLYPVETFTDGTDTWGTETSAILVSRKNAISLLMQQDLTYYEGRESKRPEVNHIFFQLFGSKVFHRNIKRLGKITFNA